MKIVGTINITSHNRRVLLTGEVQDHASKQLVERTVAGIDGVRNVFNQLAVMGPLALAERSWDMDGHSPSQCSSDFDVLPLRLDRCDPA